MMIPDTVRFKVESAETSISLTRKVCTSILSTLFRFWHFADPFVVHLGIKTSVLANLLIDFSMQSIFYPLLTILKYTYTYITNTALLDY